ncbi:hypothetical protein B0H11DRAFT_1922984 [Mycena galericulata]|nr:hypothetical protein B0H11DRAFT_1922984 [Mycena galericulata]
MGMHGMGRQLKIVLKINMSQAPAFNREGGEQGGEEQNGVACEGSAGNKHEPNARTAPAFNREGGQQGGEEWNGVSCEGSTENKHEPTNNAVDQDSRHAHSRFQPRLPLSTTRVDSRVERSGTEFPARGVTLTLAFNSSSRFRPRGWTAGWRGVERSFLRGVSRSLSLSTQAPAFNREGGEQGGEGVDGQLGPGPFLYVENRGWDLRPRIPNKYLARTPIPPCLSKSGGAAPGLKCIDAMGGTVESREEVKKYAASGRKVPGGKIVLTEHTYDS